MSRIPGLVADQATSTRLAQVRQRGTAPELVVRRALRQAGLRFRTWDNSLPGRPDIASVSGSWAVFVHGCFWHAHRGCSKATVPKRNRRFWEAKFEANRRRDSRVRRQLRLLGYRTFVVWECASEDERVLARLASRIARQIRSNRPWN